MGMDYLEILFLIEKRFGFAFSDTEPAIAKTVEDLHRIVMEHVRDEKIDPLNVYCSECGYLLNGSTTPACPECGLGFTPSEGDIEVIVFLAIAEILESVTGVPKEGILPHHDLLKDIGID